MSDPAANDDDWNDLARELGLEKSSPGSTPPPPLDPIEGDDDPEAEPIGEERPARGHPHAVREAEPDDDAAGEEAEGDDEIGGEAGAEDEGGAEAAGGEGQPGTGRKRRRRRRRRKKGGPTPAGAEATGAEPEVADESVIGYGRPTSTDEEVLEEAAADDEGEGEEAGAASSPLAAEEDTASDVLRELIATWNVPAWDDIVGGLYRPDR